MVPHLRAMLVMCCVLSSCNERTTYSDAIVAPPIDAGWHYSWNFGMPKMGYGLSVSPMMGLYGHCDDGPIYAIIGGDYTDEAESVSLIIGNKVRKFTAFPSIHGRELSFFALNEIPEVPRKYQYKEEIEIARDLANAKAPIVIRTNDGWTKLIPPSVNFARFLRECVAYRRAEDTTKHSN